MSDSITLTYAQLGAMLGACQRGQPATSDATASLLSIILERINTMSASLTDRITALQAAVRAETTVNASAVTLIQGLTATLGQVRAQLAASGDVSAALTAIDQATNAISSSQQALASAVTAGTAAAGATTTGTTGTTSTGTPAATGTGTTTGTVSGAVPTTQSTLQAG